VLGCAWCTGLANHADVDVDERGVGRYSPPQQRGHRSEVESVEVEPSGDAAHRLRLKARDVRIHVALVSRPVAGRGCLEDCRAIYRFSRVGE